MRGSPLSARWSLSNATRAANTGVETLQRHHQSVQKCFLKDKSCSLQHIPSPRRQVLLAMIPKPIIHPLRSDIRKPSPTRIIIPLPLVPIQLKIFPHSFILPLRPRKVIGKPTRREIRRLLRPNPLCRSHARYVRARRRERRNKPCRFRAVVGLARHSGAKVSGRDNDGDAAGAELAEHVADLLGVGLGEELLVGAVGDGDDAGEMLVGEVEEVACEFEVWFEVVVGRINQAINMINISITS